MTNALRVTVYWSQLGVEMSLKCRVKRKAPFPFPSIARRSTRRENPGGILGHPRWFLQTSNKNMIPINRRTRQTWQSHAYHHRTFIRESYCTYKHAHTHIDTRTRTYVRVGIHTYNTDTHTRVHARYVSLEVHWVHASHVSEVHSRRRMLRDRRHLDRGRAAKIQALRATGHRSNDGSRFLA